MELDRPPSDAETPQSGAPLVPEAPRAELRALGRLRSRVETAAREIERLRDENAALARRLLHLEDAHAAAGPHPLLADGESPAALQARVQTFIDALDRAIAAAEETAGAPGDAAPSGGAS